MSDFTLSGLREAWNQGSYDDAMALTRWNQEASRFGRMAQPTLENSLCLQMLDREGLLKAGGTGLDVGCGAGQYSFALEQYGYTMQGTDFSPGMIAQAEQNRDTLHSSASFCVDNWHTLDLSSRGWEHRFDLVLAHMTPAVIDGDSFLRLIRASRGYVFLQKPTRRHNETSRAISLLLGVQPEEDHPDASFAQAFSMAWMAGCSPKTAYRDVTWTAELGIDNAVSYYLQCMNGSYQAGPGDAEKVRQFLSEKFPEGRVTDVTHVHLAALLFRVNQEVSL